MQGNPLYSMGLAPRIGAHKLLSTRSKISLDTPSSFSPNNCIAVCIILSKELPSLLIEK